MTTFLIWSANPTDVHDSTGLATGWELGRHVLNGGWVNSQAERAVALEMHGQGVERRATAKPLCLRLLLQHWLKRTRRVDSCSAGPLAIGQDQGLFSEK